MNKLSRDELLLISLEMDTPSLLNLCRSHRSFNNSVCRQDQIWIDKLRREYGFVFKGEITRERTPRIYYNLFYYQPPDFNFEYSRYTSSLWLGNVRLLKYNNLYQNTILEAIRLGFDDIVFYFIEKINYVLSEFIYYAARFGNESTFNLLLNKRKEFEIHPHDTFSVIFTMEFATYNRNPNIFKTLLELYKKEYYQVNYFESVILEAIKNKNYLVLIEISNFLTGDPGNPWSQKHFNVFTEVLDTGDLNILKILYNEKNIHFNMFVQTAKKDNLEFLKFLTANADMKDWNRDDIPKMGNKISERDAIVLYQIDNVIMDNRSKNILKYYLSLGTYDYLIRKFPEHQEFINTVKSENASLSTKVLGFPFSYFSRRE